MIIEHDNMILEATWLWYKIKQQAEFFFFLSVETKIWHEFNNVVSEQRVLVVVLVVVVVHVVVVVVVRWQAMKMARKSGKNQKVNPAGWAGKVSLNYRFKASNVRYE